MEPTWTPLKELDKNDIFDSGRGTTKYRVLGQIGKEGGDTTIHMEVARLMHIESIPPVPYLISSDTEVRYVGKKGEVLQD